MKTNDKQTDNLPMEFAANIPYAPLAASGMTGGEFWKEVSDLDAARTGDKPAILPRQTTEKP